MRALKDPISDVFAARWQNNWRRGDGSCSAKFYKCMAGRENIAMERGWDREDDERWHFLIVLDGLEGDELAVEKREPVLANALMAGKVESSNAGFGRRRRRRQPVKQRFCV